MQNLESGVGLSFMVNPKKCLALSQRQGEGQCLGQLVRGVVKSDFTTPSVG